MGTTIEVLKVDAFDTQICVDDSLAYAVRRGSHMWLKRLKVTEVTIEDVRGYDPDDVRMRYKKLTNLTTAVVLNKPPSYADGL